MGSARPDARLRDRGQAGEGLTFLAACADDWSGSYFAIHKWWHRSLFHLELGETDEVLALYEGPIRGSRSTEWLDVVDAAAVLWRLSLFGVDVGEYAEQLAADIDPLVGEPVNLFNDWHAVMVFGLAGHHEDIERVFSGNRRQAVGTNRAVAERAGLSLLEGFGFFAAGRFDRAIDLMMDIRPLAQAVVGSQSATRHHRPDPAGRHGP